MRENFMDDIVIYTITTAILGAIIGIAIIMGLLSFLNVLPC